MDFQKRFTRFVLTTLTSSLIALGAFAYTDMQSTSAVSALEHRTSPIEQHAINTAVQPDDSQVNESDKEFLQQMIQHHQQGIYMAKMALTRATHPEILQLSRSIMKDQTSEILSMSMWYVRWYEQEAPMVRQAEVANQFVWLENAHTFDRTFLEEMMTHHMHGIEMAKQTVNITQNHELATLCDKMITQQQKELDQMMALYKLWYSEG